MSAARKKAKRKRSPLLVDILRERKPDPDLTDAYTGRRLEEPIPTVILFMRKMAKWRPASSYLSQSHRDADGYGWTVTIDWRRRT